MGNRLSGILVTGAALAGMSVGGQCFAQAQGQDTDAGKLEEVTVTATFREERLQDTPIAITAVTGEMLEQRSQTSVFEVAAQSPNVTLSPQGQANGSGLIAFIRGVGQTDFNYALEPGVDGRGDIDKFHGKSREIVTELRCSPRRRRQGFTDFLRDFLRPNA